jgi:hypothetical protein
VNCVDIFRVLFVVGFVSLCALLGQVSVMLFNLEDGQKVSMQEEKPQYLSKSSSVDLLRSLADRWKSSSCENLTEAVRGETQIAQCYKASI